jgi:deoxyribodipyrimidine photo-lyase
MPLYSTSLCWFRRDLRAEDHAALHAALTRSSVVHCLFVFDAEILDALEDRADRRVEFIRDSIVELRNALERLGGSLHVRHGSARDLVPALAAELGVDAVFANRDYEPQAVARDAAVERSLAADGRAFLLFKDQVIFERDEVLTGAGRPYTVFTPYKNNWLKKLESRHLAPHPVEPHAAALAPARPGPIPSLEQLGFRPTNYVALGIRPGMSGARALWDEFRARMGRYRDHRDFPAIKGPSYLSVHLRFGTMSIRELAREASLAEGEGPATWLSELVWRDFYFMILHHFPRVVDHSFRPEYDALPYPNDPLRFDAWCKGRTGYPLVDAAMRQLNETGYMHNRLRMVAASFLIKDLLIDWRWGERYFAARLNDYDLSANNGGWQWAASTGCDAQPYFRIFNPVTQSEKFDPDGKFIRRYVPELARCDARRIHAPWLMNTGEQVQAGVVIGRDYPAPVVDHAESRAEALALYKRDR